MYAGDNEDLVLHLYAAGSEIDDTIKQQTSTSIAATGEDEIDDAEIDDPLYNGDGDGGASNATTAANGATTAADSATTAANSVAADLVGSGTPTASVISRVPATTAASVASQAPSVAPEIVQGPGTFDYFGCLLDSSDSRALTSKNWSGTGLTVQRCADFCSDYKYMGVEFGAEYVLRCALILLGFVKL